MTGLFCILGILPINLLRNSFNSFILISFCLTVELVEFVELPNIVWHVSSGCNPSDVVE